MRSGSKPRCGRRPSCPTFRGPASPHPASASSAPRPDRASAGARASWRRMVGTGHVRAGSRIRFRRPAHPRRAHGDVFRVNGHKIWTTQAHQSRWCTLYARTDPDAPKHRGISCLILDLQSPGRADRTHPDVVDLRRDFLRGLPRRRRDSGENLLGPVNGGWNVALSSLHHERQMIWIMNWVEIKRGLDAVRRARHGAAEDGQDLYAELGSLLADAEALRATGYRALGNELAGRSSPEADIMKLLGSVTLQRVWEVAAAAEGARSASDPDLLRTPGRACRHHLRRDVGGAAQHHRRATARAAEGITMDYDLGDDAVELRHRLRELIANHVPADFLGACTEDPEDLATTETFCKLLAAEGLLALAWPKEHGGGGGSVWQQTVLREEMWAQHEPRGPQYMGVNWVGPALMRYGTEEQKARTPGGDRFRRCHLVPRLFRTRSRIRPRVVAHASGAGRGRLAHHRSEGVDVVCADGVVVRLATCTDPDAPKHKRLTLFLIPMDREGFTVPGDPIDAGPSSPQRDVLRRRAGVPRRRAR